jgi:hypothetical protein
VRPFFAGAGAFFGAAALEAGCFDASALEAGDLRDLPLPRSLISYLPVGEQRHWCVVHNLPPTKT